MRARIVQYSTLEKKYNLKEVEQWLEDNIPNYDADNFMYSAGDYDFSYRWMAGAFSYYFGNDKDYLLFLLRWP